MRGKYKNDLTDDDQKEVLAACTKEDDAGDLAAGVAGVVDTLMLLPLMKEFMMEQLSEDHIGANLPIKVI